MEMFSIRFIDRVREIFSDPAATIIATVPSKPLPFAEEIRSGRNTIQFVVRTRYVLNHAINFSFIIFKS